MRGDRARSALGETRFADVRWVDETGSTNRDLLDLAAAGAPEGVVVVADLQHAGRGRLDRSWHAPVGGSLLVSILFRPLLGATDAHLLTTAVGVSAAAACRSVGGVAPRLKWPNDLVVEVEGSDGPGAATSDRKLAGILAESTVEGGRLAAVVVGIGLNVNWPADLPPELADIAIALNHLTGHEVDREDLLIALLSHLDQWCTTLQAPDRAAQLMAQARAWSATLGRTIRVDLGDEQIVGEAVELTDDGALVVGRERRVVVAGDVVHLRSLDRP
ncbi:MAG TPA: biotin--[acetyl-CoA-carboxylase] ligase [Acidimicrobiales bacterium]